MTSEEGQEKLRDQLVSLDLMCEATDLIEKSRPKTIGSSFQELAAGIASTGPEDHSVEVLAMWMLASSLLLKILGPALMVGYLAMEHSSKKAEEPMMQKPAEA